MLRRFFAIGLVVAGCGGSAAQTESAPEPAAVAPASVAAGEEPDVGSQRRCRGQVVSCDARLVHFGVESAVLRAPVTPLLDDMVAALVERPEILSAVIRGSRQTSGPRAEREDIAGMRAGAVRDYIVQRGVDPARVSTVALEEQPYPGNGAEVAAQNRRVEVVIAAQQWSERANADPPRTRTVCTAVGAIHVLLGSRECPEDFPPPPPRPPPEPLPEGTELRTPFE